MKARTSLVTAVAAFVVAAPAANAMIPGDGGISWPVKQKVTVSHHPRLALASHRSTSAYRQTGASALRNTGSSAIGG